jgi:hypothetical protein
VVLLLIAFDQHMARDPECFKYPWVTLGDQIKLSLQRNPVVSYSFPYCLHRFPTYPERFAFFHIKPSLLQ